MVMDPRIVGHGEPATGPTKWKAEIRTTAGEKITATHTPGGQYVDLRFGDQTVATDAINLIDGEGHRTVLRTFDEFVNRVKAWIVARNQDDPEWYDQYLAQRP